MSKTRIICFFLSPVIGILAIVVIIALMNLFIDSKMTPELREQYRAWKEDPMILSKDAFNVVPFQAETVAAAENFRKNYASLKPVAEDAINTIRINNAIKPKSQDIFDKIFETTAALPIRQLDRLTTLVTTFENLVRRPDYHIEADVAGLLLKEGIPGESSTLGGTPILNYPRFQVATRLMALQAIRMAREGRPAEAMAEAELIINAARTSPYSDPICQLSGITANLLGIRTMSYVMDRTEDPSLLEKSLKCLNDIAQAQSYFPEKMVLKSLDEISGLRWLKRQGWAIPDVQGGTGSELSWSANSAQIDFLNRVVLSQVKTNPLLQNRQQEVLQGISSLSSAAYQMGPTHVTPALIKANPLAAAKYAALHESSRKTLFQMGQPDSRALRLRGKIAITQMNLMRLKTARKLYRLREGREAPGSVALVPKYLPKLPEDPFDAKEKTLKFREVDYSLGPDGTNQQAAVCYDPTNGTESAGDIFLK